MWKKRFVYLDNAATTRVRPEAMQAMQPYFQWYYGNPSSSYEFGTMANKVLEEGRTVLSGMLHAKPEEIYYTSGGTESDNWALLGVALANFGRGNHIITSRIEHPAILNTCEHLKRYGFQISYIDVNKEGVVDLEKLKKAIRRETVLITIMTANNEVGTIQPVSEIGKIARRNQIIFHTDAVQAFAHIPIDVEAQKIDMLSVSSHKFGGPKGTGFLYVREGVTVIPFMHGGHQENNMRAGTGNVTGIAGMTAAAGYASEHMAETMKYETGLRDYMIRRILQEIPDTKLNGSKTNRLPGNVHVSFAGVDGGTLQAMLDMRGICVSTGSACSSKSQEPSEVLKAMGMSDEQAYSAIRITLSGHNTREEIDYTVEEIKSCVTELRKKNH